MTLTYRVGDYVTAVYLRSKPEKSLRLYGFLDLRPKLGVIASAKQEAGVLHVIALIAAIAALFFALGWNVYAFGKFSPVELSIRDHALPFAIGAVILGGIFLGSIAWSIRRDRRKLEEKNQQAAVQGGAIEIPWRSKIGLFGHGRLMSILLLFGGAMLGGADHALLGIHAERAVRLVAGSASAGANP